MPEGLEIELYRRLAELAVGRRVTGAELFEDYGRGGLTAEGLRAAVRGTAVGGARRRGKFLLLDLNRTRARRPATEGPDVVLGLRFGMTGTLKLDGRRGVDELVYLEHAPQAGVGTVLGCGSPAAGRSSSAIRAGSGAWSLKPDVARLGPDAATVTLPELRAALAGSVAPLKARLMDQARLAGLGNLLADEILWRAGLAPGRQAGGLTPVELRRLHRHLRATMDELLVLGGSHLGRLMPERHLDGRCPRDGEPLVRATVGGRTSYWCPRHQR